jgi:hypothetical protein
MIGSMGMIGTEQVAEPGAQWRPALRAARHEWIERGSGTSFSGLHGERRQQAGTAAGAEIQYLVANGHADGGLPFTLEYAKGQVLNRECATGTIG